MDSKDYLNINIIDETVSDKNIKHLIEGYVSINNIKINKVKTKIEIKDILGTIKVRFGIGRNDYAIPPGLYAVGNPDENSFILATANYKLTFDALRKELDGLNVWILVLDTKGINVWCAAGKGTFGTKELINRIRKTNLGTIVKNRTIILPQLGASSMIAHIVTKITGFKIVYGPVRAKDIKKFIQDGLKATEEMRKVNFNLFDRLVLTPIELVHALKYFPFIFITLMMLNIISGQYNLRGLLTLTINNSFAYFVALFLGTIIFPLLLPYLPFTMFSAKGALLGFIWSIMFWFIHKSFLFSDGFLLIIGHSLLMTAMISFLSMNFTGSTTFTSFSGVQKETLLSVPVMVISSIIGMILLILDIFI